METIFKINLGGIGMKKKILAYGLSLLMMTSLSPATIYAVGLDAQDVYSYEKISSILNDEGQFVMYSVKPANEMQAMLYFQENMTFWEKYPNYRFENFNEDFTTCDISYINMDTGEYEETLRVNIKYVYDPNVAVVVDKIISTLPEGDGEYPYYYAVNDLALVNYWVNSNNIDYLIDYSDELKGYLDYKNFKIDCRMGMDAEFATESQGLAPFMYDDVMYSVEEMGVRGEHFIYVSEDTEDTADALMAAAIDRIEDYIGEGKVKITYGGQDIRKHYESIYDVLIDKTNTQIAELGSELAEYTQLRDECEEKSQEYYSLIEEAYNNAQECQDSINYYTELLNSDPENAPEYETYIQDYWVKYDGYIALTNQYSDEQFAIEEEKWGYDSKVNSISGEIEMYKMELDSHVGTKEFFLNAYDDADGDYYYLQQAAGGYWFYLEAGGEKHMFVILKDNDKITIPTYKSVDVSTEVEVTCEGTNIPLDTRIGVDKLTEGEEYQKIMEVLDVKENATFDITLFSMSVDEYISKLDNGTFEVKLPLSDNFKNKSLIVYFVDDSKNIVEYNVEVINGYAAFNTDHFSIYTLAEKPVAPEITVEADDAVVSEDYIKDIITEMDDSDVATSDNITIPVKDIATGVTSVKIPSEALMNIVSFEKGLTVETNESVVTLDSVALKNITDKVEANSTIRLDVKSIKEDSLSQSQKDAIKDETIEKIISAELFCNDEYISDFGNGKASVQIPFELPEGTEGCDYEVWYIADNGDIEILPTSYSDGFISVELEHFSEYVIVNIADDLGGKEPLGDGVNVTLLVVISLTSMCALGMVARKRR